MPTPSPWSASASRRTATGSANRSRGAGAVGSVITTTLFATQATNPRTSYHTLGLIVAAQAVCSGAVSGPWLANFTETVEDRNPALVATGLAVGSAVMRAVIALS